jgi:polysaccharide deacetylase family protein (PEP-CTERM system associated)
MNPSAIVNALTIDVEEYYHALVFREGAPDAVSGRPESRVEMSTGRVLALLAAHEVKATFFVLGQVASDHPGLVQKIAGDGHEVACHGHAHEPVSRQTPDQFRTDIRRAKATLEDIVGEAVVGYRAPNFSIGPAQAWAYDILVEEGFRYDSSVYPILHDSYGDTTAPRFPHTVRRNGHGTLVEVPIGTARLLGINLPLGGGGYFRLLPSRLFRTGIHYVNTRERQPIIFYFHPWELDPDQPQPAMPLRHRFRHYVGMRREEAKLSRLFRHIRFSTVRTVIGL